MVEFETEVTEVIKRTHDVKSFRFKKKDGVDFKAGQFLFVTIKIGGAERTKHFSFSRYRKVYSVYHCENRTLWLLPKAIFLNSPTEKGYIEFTKKLTESDYSKALDRLKAGDWAKLKLPYGSFTYESEYKRIAFLSGGIGITPIRSICKYVIDRRLDADMVLIYGNRTVNDIVFRDDFDTMQNVPSKLRVVHVLSEAGPEWPGRKGHINAEIIKEEIPDYSERKFYICGPPSMVDGMKKMLSDELKVAGRNVIMENFTGY